MGNINDAFPSNYLRASDLKGVQTTVTIDRVEYEDVGRQKDRKPILYFIGKEKGLVLNKTNANKIIEITGSPVTEEWHGIRIRLYATMVEFAGDQVEAIRVKAAPANAAAAPAPPPQPPPASELTDDDIPF